MWASTNRDQRKPDLLPSHRVRIRRINAQALQKKKAAHTIIRRLCDNAYIQLKPSCPQNMLTHTRI